MVKVPQQQRHFFKEARKRIGVPRHCGRAMCGFAYCGDDTVSVKLANGSEEILTGIYQIRTRYGRRVQTREEYRTGGASNTPAQQVRREKFKQAVAAWQALTPEEKSAYNKRSKRLKIFGYSLYLREYMRIMPDPALPDPAAICGVALCGVALCGAET